jgi:excisionase family DNA binding protein
MQPRETWSTVAQAAEYLQVCDITILRWIKCGKLPASRIGKSYRIAVADLDTMLNKGKTAAA